MIDGTTFVVLCLAVARLTRLVIRDDITARPRQWLIDHSPQFVGELLGCQWCASVYCATAIVVALDLYVSVPLPALQVAASAYIAGIILSTVDLKPKPAQHG